MTTYARLPERMRIIELARRLDVPAVEVQKRLNRLDIDAPTVLTSVTRSDVRLVLEDYRTGDFNGSTAPDPELIDELLDSIGPSPLSRINDSALTSGNDFVAHFRKDDDSDDDLLQQDLTIGARRDELAVQIDLDQASVEAARAEKGDVASDTVVDEQLPERLRVFELAKRIDVPSAELLERLNRLGVEANSVLKGIGRSDMRLVLEDYRTTVEGGTAPDSELIDELLVTLGVQPEVNQAQNPETDTLQDALPDDAAEADRGEAGKDVTEAATTGVDTSEEDVLEEAAAPHPEPEEIVEPEAPIPLTDVVEDTPDDVLGAALLRAGVIEGADTSKNGVEAEPARTTQSRRAKGWRGVNAPARIIAIGIAILVGTMVLSTVYAVLRPTFAAESEIVITISGQGSDAVQRELQSFAVVATSQTVLAPVAEQFGMSVVDVRDAFEPAIVGDSTVLRFTTTASSPDDALALNEAITASYLAVANEPLDQSELAFVSDRMAQLTEQIAGLDSELSDLELTEAANASTRLQIESERNVAQTQLADLGGRLVDLRASGAAPPGSVTFVEGQINTTQARLDQLVADAQTLEASDAGVRSAANRLRDERTVLRSELGDLQELQVQIEFDQVAGNRVSVLAAGHAIDEPVGLTPVRAAVLGLLVGSALAFAWVVAATQLRKKR